MSFQTNNLKHLSSEHKLRYF